jgi:hypothetical protein
MGVTFRPAGVAPGAARDPQIDPHQADTPFGRRGVPARSISAPSLSPLCRGVAPGG